MLWPATAAKYERVCGAGAGQVDRVQISECLLEGYGERRVGRFSRNRIASRFHCKYETSRRQ